MPTDLSDGFLYRKRVMINARKYLRSRLDILPYQLTKVQDLARDVISQRNVSGQGHSTVKIPVRKRAIRVLAYRFIRLLPYK
jgi:hypothetical protein